MKRLLFWLVRLYPSEWRSRYGPELEALLEDAPPRWSHVIDITFEALVMHLKRPLTVLTLGALVGTIVGASAMWPHAKVFWSRAEVYFPGDNLHARDSSGRYRVIDVLAGLERREAGLEFRHVFANGTAVPAGDTLIRIGGRGTSPTEAQRTARRLVARLEGLSESAVVVSDPSLPGGPHAQVPRWSWVGLMNSAAHGLFVAYLLLLMAPVYRGAVKLIGARSRLLS